MICEKHEYTLEGACGVDVCIFCGDHKGLARCFCGFSRTNPGRGRTELLEMGETIDDWDEQYEWPDPDGNFR